MSLLSKCVRRIGTVGNFTRRNMNVSWDVDFDKLRTRVCTNNTLMFTGGVDDILRDEFPNVDTVILKDCDKNFVNFNLNNKLFPNMRSVISNSYPPECIPEDINMFLTERWFKVVDLRDNKNVRPICINQFAKVIHNIDLNKPTFTPKSVKLHIFNDP